MKSREMHLGDVSWMYCFQPANRSRSHCSQWLCKSVAVLAVSSTGRQLGILTDNKFNKARIKSINGARLKKSLDEGYVVVVAGFQGVDEEGNITTLGRGGSDTTAVALAAAVEADECQIYTDVDGVYTTDPRVEPNARRLERITFEEMLEMASLGSKVVANPGC